MSKNKKNLLAYIPFFLVVFTVIFLTNPKSANAAIYSTNFNNDPISEGWSYIANTGPGQREDFYGGWVSGVYSFKMFCAPPVCGVARPASIIKRFTVSQNTGYQAWVSAHVNGGAVYGVGNVTISAYDPRNGANMARAQCSDHPYKCGREDIYNTQTGEVRFVDLIGVGFTTQTGQTSVDIVIDGFSDNSVRQFGAPDPYIDDFTIFQNGTQQPPTQPPRPPVPPVSASCSASPNPATTGVTVTWTATISSGGTGVYTYVWSGADLSATTYFTQSRTNSTTKSYSTSGGRTATITIYSGDGNGGVTSRAFTCSVQINAPPASVPQNVHIINNPSCNGASPIVNLRWDASTNASSYSVYRNGVFQAGVSITSFDQSIGNLGSYNYTVSAFNSASVESAQSSAATNIAVDCRAPDAATNFAALPSCNSSTPRLTITFTAGARATKHQLLNGSSGQLIHDDLVSGYIYDNLATTTSYSFIIRSINTAGGGSSATDTAGFTGTTNDCNAPDAPTSPAAIPGCIGANPNLFVNWGATSRNNQLGVTYQINLYDGVSRYIPLVNTGTGISYAHNNLAQAAHYYYQIVPTNPSSGLTGTAGYTDNITYDCRPPDNFTFNSVTPECSSTSSVAKLNFDSAGPRAGSYEIYRAILGVTDWSTLPVAQSPSAGDYRNSLGNAITPFYQNPPGQNYYITADNQYSIGYYIIARNTNSGLGTVSYVSPGVISRSVVPWDCNAPDAPVVTVDDSCNTTYNTPKIRLTWPATAHSHQYTLTRTLAGNSLYDGSRDYTDINVSNNTQYTYTVTAINTNNNGQTSSTRSPYTRNCTPPNPPTADPPYCASNVSNINVYSSQNSPNVAGFNIYRWDVTNGWVRANSSLASSLFTDQPASNTAYNYRVTSVAGVPGSSESPPSSQIGPLFTLNCTPPVLSSSNNGCGGPSSQDPNLNLLASSSIQSPNIDYFHLERNRTSVPAVGYGRISPDAGINAIGSPPSGQMTDQRNNLINNRPSGDNTINLYGLQDLVSYKYRAYSVADSLPGDTRTQAQKISPYSSEMPITTAKCDTINPITDFPAAFGICYNIENPTVTLGSVKWSQRASPIVEGHSSENAPADAQGPHASGVKETKFKITKIFTLAGAVSPSDQQLAANFRELTVANPQATSLTGAPSDTQNRIYSSYWGFPFASSLSFLTSMGVDNQYKIEMQATDYVGNVSSWARGSQDFFYLNSCVSPWLKTQKGDVHSNENITTPGGPN